MNFFRDLQKKIIKSPDRSFDQRMRNLIDQELGMERPTSSRPLGFFRLVIPFAAASLLIGFYFKTQPLPSPQTPETFGDTLEFIQSLETLGGLEHEELMGASEEEWAEVLQGVES